MAEREEALLLATRLLDEPNADPDDDLRVLARQLLRREEQMVFGEDTKAVAIGQQKLVGVAQTGPDEPVEQGNCFSVHLEGGGYAVVVNFAVENLRKLLTKGLTWPVACRRIGDVAIIHDPRIGNRWYDDHYCEICCPKVLLPSPQLRRQEREIACGRRRESAGSISIQLGIKAEFE